MATVTTAVAADINWLLDYLFRSWETVGEVAAEWNEWGRDSRIDFLIDWPVKDDKLASLQEYMERGDLTDAQARRYADLMRMIDRLQPAVEHMFATADDGPPGP